MNVLFDLTEVTLSVFVYGLDSGTRWFGLGLCMLLQDKNLKQKDKEARL